MRLPTSPFHLDVGRRLWILVRKSSDPEHFDLRFVMELLLVDKAVMISDRPRHIVEHASRMNIRARIMLKEDTGHAMTKPVRHNREKSYRPTFPLQPYAYTGLVYGG